MAVLAMQPATFAVFAALAVVFFAARALLNHVRHPLYKFPGPRLASWSNVLYSYWFLSGRQPQHILALHRKYGPVVRTAPNELSFNSARSWQDIYNFRPGRRPFVKSPFYDGGSFADQAHSIVSERDPAAHGRMRRYLSNAFSDRSLKAQEGLVVEVVDQLMSELEKNATGPEGTDMVMYFNLATFDIIGSLAFGESFGGVESGKYHFWIELVTNALRQGALADSLSRFPMVAKLITSLFPGMLRKLVEDTRTHERHTMGLIKRRLGTRTDRPDFLTRILEQGDEKDVSDVQLAAHASDFVTAGSETTATTLSCATYYLLKNPRVLSLLQDEVRGAFSTEAEITAASTNRLPYLRAVALEAMRVYAPLPFALPRVVPEGGESVDGHWLPAGTIVATSPYAASLDERNFSEPDVFRPERWLGEEGEDVLEAAQPFSLGARGCLGRNLAWMELGVILSRVIFAFDMELLDKNLDWQRDSRMQTLWKKPVLKVRLTKRVLKEKAEGEKA